MDFEYQLTLKNSSFLFIKLNIGVLNHIAFAVILYTQ